MATLTEYPLPLNPLPYSPRVSFLKFLTVGATGDYVYYTKNVSNVVGELALTMKDAATGGDQPSSTASHKRVREWMVPAKLLDKRGWCDLQGITHDTAGLIWIACVDGNRLLSLDTGVGLYTAFFGGGPGQEVFPAPRDLQFDARGILWFTAATSVAPMIGRFDRTTMKVTIRAQGVVLFVQWKRFRDGTAVGNARRCRERGDDVELQRTLPS
jgi:hypothetical protein